MKNNLYLIFALGVFLFGGQACGNSSATQNSVAVPVANSNSLADVPTQNLQPKKGTEEKTFTFAAQDDRKITAFVYSNPKKPGGKMIVFEPFPAQTDVNLYNASLNSLWNLYGEERGQFKLADAKTEFDSDLGGSAICWNAENPAQQFCVLPIKESATGGITALHVWLK